MKRHLTDKNDARGANTPFPRGARLLLGFFLCIAALFLALWLWRVSFRNLYRQNPSFVLEKEEIVVESEILRRDVENTILANGVRLYESYLPELPLGVLREALLKNPRIADVRLIRHYPDTLRIEISPRIPVAILHFSKASGKAELLVDQEGMVLPRNTLANTQKLPTVIGLKEPGEFQEGVRSEDKALLAFLTFLKESRLRPEGNRYEIVNVRLDSKNERMTMTLEANSLFKPGAQIVMPTENIPQEMDRLQIVVDLRIAANETISYLNATYKNIPVRP